MEIHAEILEKEGVPQFAILPFEEFQRIQSLLEDYEDLMDLHTAKALTKQTLSFETIQAEFKD